MKNLLFLPVFYFAFFSASAQAENVASLQLRLSNDRNIAIDIDGQFINRQTTSLTLDGLSAGRHKITVFSVNARGNRAKRIYTGHLRFNANTRYEGFVDVRSRILNLAAHPVVVANQAEQNQNNVPEVPSPAPANITPQQSTEPSQMDEELQPAVGSFPKGRSGMNTQQAQHAFSRTSMDNLKKAIAKNQTDTDKEKLLKASVEGQDIYTSQVREMLDWLMFESSKLDFAKWAYSYVKDTENYNALTDVFSESTSKKDFAQFINR